MMTISTGILERHYQNFTLFISEKDGQPFSDFRSSKFIDEEENYKYSVYEEARENLELKWWKSEEIGSGKIQNKISAAIKATVIHNYQTHQNNLVDCRKKGCICKNRQKQKP